MFILKAAFSLANAKDDALNWLEHEADIGWINYPLLADINKQSKTPILRFVTYQCMIIVLRPDFEVVK